MRTVLSVASIPRPQRILVSKLRNEAQDGEGEYEQSSCEEFPLTDQDHQLCVLLPEQVEQSVKHCGTEREIDVSCTG